MEKAVFSYRSLPHWGRGTASAVDRVLSYNACLRRIFHLFQLSFMPIEPYPARYARHLPLEGKAAIRECGYTRNTAWKGKRRRLRRKKGSQPRLAALGSPFQGKGLAWILPPSYGRRCPEGAEVGWVKRYFCIQVFPSRGRLAI